MVLHAPHDVVWVLRLPVGAERQESLKHISDGYYSHQAPFTINNAETIQTLVVQELSRAPYIHFRGNPVG